MPSLLSPYFTVSTEEWVKPPFQKTPFGRCRSSGILLSAYGLSYMLLYIFKPLWIRLRRLQHSLPFTYWQSHLPMLAPSAQEMKMVDLLPIVPWLALWHWCLSSLSAPFCIGHAREQITNWLKKANCLDSPIYNSLSCQTINQHHTNPMKRTHLMNSGAIS